KVLFASCAPGLLDRAVARARSIHPELPLEVVSESAPGAARWIQYRTDGAFTDNLRHCRDRLRGKRIELAMVMLQQGTPHRRLQVIAFLVRSQCLLAVNENLDYFEVSFRAAGPILRHLRWRFREWAQRMRSAANRHMAV